jgi:flagellar motility protein MotE (MotC chaperone)
MRLEQIKEMLYEKLENDPFFGIALFDPTTYKPILKSSSKEQIIQSYGSIDDFFNQIFSNPTQKVAIRIKRKNGISNNSQNWKDTSDDLIIYNPTEVQLKNDVVDPASVISNIAPLNGHMQNALMIPYDRYTDLHHDQREKQRLEKDLEELKERHKRAKKKLKRLEKDQTSEDKNITKMNSHYDGAAKVLEKAAPLLGPLIEKLTAGASGEASLAAPNYSGLSQDKVDLMESIANSDQMTTKILFTTLNGMSNENFVSDLYELFQKHNLINAPNEQNNPS